MPWLTGSTFSGAALPFGGSLSCPFFSMILIFRIAGLDVYSSTRWHAFSRRFKPYRSPSLVRLAQDLYPYSGSLPALRKCLTAAVVLSPAVWAQRRNSSALYERYFLCSMGICSGWIIGSRCCLDILLWEATLDPWKKISTKFLVSRMLTCELP